MFAIRQTNIPFTPRHTAKFSGVRWTANENELTQSWVTDCYAVLMTAASKPSLPMSA